MKGTEESPQQVATLAPFTKMATELNDVVHLVNVRR